MNPLSVVQSPQFFPLLQAPELDAGAVEAWSGARKLLCVRVDYLGDVLMCTPALRALKSDSTGRHITLLTSAGGAAVARFVPEVDQVTVYDAPWLKHGAQHAAADDLAMIEALRAESYDAAVIFTTYSQSALPAAMLCHLAGIPLRLAHCRENPYRLLSHWIAEPEPQQLVRHEVRRQLDLVASLGYRAANEKLSFVVPHQERHWARQRLGQLGISPDRPWLLLHPGASAASRRYSAQAWREVLRQLIGELAIPVLLTGSANEAQLIASIAPDHHALVHIEAGTLELGQLGALIARASVLVSGNTGPAHIAAAVGTPVVDLYALTNPQHAPWQVASRVLFHDVPCRNCYKSVCPQGHHDCLEKVAPGQVVQAVRELLPAHAAASGGNAPRAIRARLDDVLPSPTSAGAGSAAPALRAASVKPA